MPNVIVRADNTKAGITNGTFASNFKASKKGVERNVTFTIRVIAESLATTDVQILATADLPQLYESFANVYVSEINAVQESPAKHPVTKVDTWVWKVDFTLTSELDLEGIPPGADPLSAINPLLIPAEVSTDTITQLAPFNDRDAEGKVISNYFGEQLAEEIITEIEIYVVTITRWEVWPFPYTKSRQYNNTCNLNAFHGLPAGTCLMKVRAPKSYYDGTPYARATYQIKVLIDPQDPAKEDTWVDLKLPHTSYKFLETAGDPSSETTKNVFGNEGPFLLKADGTLSSFGNTFQPGVDNSDHTLTFKKKRKVDWGPLSLPDG